MPDDVYNDSDSESDVDVQVMLGYALEPSASLQRNHFPSKMGGSPAWLDPVGLPLDAQLRCAASGQPMRFLMQVYAATSDDPQAFHRSIYLFISPRGSVLCRPGAVRALRCQLPRDNPYYPYDPPEEDEMPRALRPEEAHVARQRCPIWTTPTAPAMAA